MLFRYLLLLFAGSVWAKPQITWLQTDWPPHQIVSGPFQGQGTFDLLRQQLISAMPQFEHQSRLVSLARLEQIFLQQEPGMCAIGTLFSAERAQTRLFSQPVAAGPALAIGYVQQRLNQYGAVQGVAIDINKLALDARLLGAYQPNRYYPPVVEQMLQHPTTNLSRHAFTSELNAAALLASGRVDYVLEYPERMQYYNQLLKQPVMLTHKAIAGATHASVSHITCTLGSAGEIAIAAVDQALIQLWQQPEYLLAMRRWLDETAWQRLAPDIHQVQQMYRMAQQ